MLQSNIWWLLSILFFGRQQAQGKRGTLLQVSENGVLYVYQHETAAKCRSLSLRRA